MKGKPGHPPLCMVQQAWADRFGIPIANRKRDFPLRLLRQLSLCKGDDERKLLLGIGDKF